MNYEFSIESYDSLKDFLEIVQSSKASNETNDDNNKWKQIFPQNLELLDKLSKHTSACSSKENVVDIKDAPNEAEMNTETIEEKMDDEDHLLPSSTQECNDTDNESMKVDYATEMLNLLNKDDLVSDTNVADQLVEIIQIIKPIELVKIVEGIKNNNLLFLAKAVVKCKKEVVEIFCDAVLPILNHKDPQTASTILLILLDKHKPIVYASIVKFLVANCTANNVSNNFIDTIRILPDEIKSDIFSKLIFNLPTVNELELSIIDSFLLNKVELKVVKKLLDLLTQNATKLAVHRKFAILLQNIINAIKEEQDKTSLLEQLTRLVQIIPGGHRIKLQKLLANLSTDSY